MPKATLYVIIVLLSSIIHPGFIIVEDSTTNSHNDKDKVALIAAVTDREGCETIDFDTDGDGNPILPGQVIDASTYAALGVSIQGFANFGSGFVPNELVAFDSSNPSGGDDDLGTPSENCPTCDPMTMNCPGVSNNGAGLTNCTPLGNILIVEENFTDTNGDGLDDDPDDHGPGMIIFDFDCPVNISTISFVDDSEGEFIATRVDGTVVTHTLDGGLDNDVFTQVFNEGDVVQLVVDFEGSGAVSGVNFCYESDFVCDLVTPVLGADQFICSGTDPGPVPITSGATGTGTITYQWQESSTDCDGAFADLMGETNPTFNPPVITTDRFYRVRLTLSDGTSMCTEISNCIAYFVTNTPNVVLTPPDPICSSDPPVNLTATPLGLSLIHI